MVKQLYFSKNNFLISCIYYAENLHPKNSFHIVYANESSFYPQKVICTDAMNEKSKVKIMKESEIKNDKVKSLEF